MKKTTGECRGSADALKIKQYIEALEEEQLEEFLNESAVQSFLSENGITDCSDKCGLEMAMEGMEEETQAGLIKLFES